LTQTAAAAPIWYDVVRQRLAAPDPEVVTVSSAVTVAPGATVTELALSSVAFTVAA